MTAAEFFQAGRLSEAITAQIAKVKSAPTDQPARFFLFELFCFAGDLDRACKQLDVLKYDDPKHSAAVEQYRFALEAETQRRAVLQGQAQPRGLVPVVEHLQLRLEALPLLAAGNGPAAREKLDAAQAATPHTTFLLNGKPVEGLQDCDDRFGGILELYGTKGTYSWLPMEAIQSLTLNPPASPRDILFRPAQLVLMDGLQGDVLLPGIYPFTHTCDDEELILGRATDWQGPDDLVPRALGGKCFQDASGTTYPLATLLQLLQPNTDAPE
jgi:type VI secretion system protein ImpE